MIRAIPLLTTIRCTQIFARTNAIDLRLHDIFAVKSLRNINVQE